MMTNLERVLARYVPEDKIQTAKFEFLAAVLMDMQEPMQIDGLLGDEDVIEIESPEVITSKDYREAHQRCHKWLMLTVELLAQSQNRTHSNNSDKELGE